jgi:Raf kinase inhibitor-like YbhB/YbcL family protein
MIFNTRIDRLCIRLCALAMATSLCVTATELAESASTSPFVLSSSDPQLAISVPEIYTAKAFGCTGGNLSPPLQWRGAPTGTKSFVVTLFDRDERSTPSGWWHWVVYDLPSTIDRLAVGAGAENTKLLPIEALQGRTDLGEDAYHGPCPAKGDPPHRYVFTIYALNVAKLPVPADSSGAMVTSVAQDHLLEGCLYCPLRALKDPRSTSPRPPRRQTGATRSRSGDESQIKGEIAAPSFGTEILMKSMTSAPGPAVPCDKSLAKE